MLAYFFLWSVSKPFESLTVINVGNAAFYLVVMIKKEFEALAFYFINTYLTSDPFKHGCHGSYIYLLQKNIYETCERTAWKMAYKPE